jgi:anaerobic selenocysteine-containing dehydrogenase
MAEIDRTWQVRTDSIEINEEINIARLGWKNGDCFKLVNINGQVKLVKLDPLEKFVRGYN